MPLQNNKHRPLFLWIGVIAALFLGCMVIPPAGYIRTLVNIGFTVVFVLLLRQVFASGAIYNPLGADRDFSLAPAVKDLLIGAAYALAAVAWAGGCAVAVRSHLLPDIALPVYSVGVVPLFLLFGAFVFFFGRAIFPRCSAEPGAGSDETASRVPRRKSRKALPRLHPADGCSYGESATHRDRLEL